MQNQPIHQATPQPTHTLSSHHNRKSCSFDQSYPINKSEAPTYQPGIQLYSGSAKGASLQGKSLLKLINYPAQFSSIPTQAGEY